jgi:hypothetical protein
MGLFFGAKPKGERWDLSIEKEKYRIFGSYSHVKLLAPFALHGFFSQSLLSKNIGAEFRTFTRGFFVAGIAINSKRGMNTLNFGAGVQSANKQRAIMHEPKLRLGVSLYIYVYSPGKGNCGVKFYDPRKKAGGMY